MVVGVVYCLTRTTLQTPATNQINSIKEDLVLTATPKEVINSSLKVVYSATLKNSLGRGSGSMILSISCPSGIKATSSSGMNACNSPVVFNGTITEIYYENPTGKPRSVKATAKILSGKDGVSVVAESDVVIPI